MKSKWLIFTVQLRAWSTAKLAEVRTGGKCGLHRSINPARLFDINTFQSADEPTYVGQLGYPHEGASRCHLKRMHMTEKNGDLAVWRADRARFEAQLGDKYVAGMFTPLIYC